LDIPGDLHIQTNDGEYPSNMINVNIFKKLARSSVFWLFVIGIALLVFEGNIRLVERSDDADFLQMAQSKSYISFITVRYLTWSSRIIAETLTYFLVKENLIIWKILNVLMIFLMAYSANRIFRKKVSIIDFVFMLFTFGLIGNRILTSSTFAFHGSFNYMWPTAAGLFALIPLADVFFRSEMPGNLGIKILHGAAIVLSVLSNEQMGLILFVFYCLYLAYAYFKGIKTPKFLYVYLALIFCLLLIFYLAPGNSLRYHAEIVAWYPDFNQISFLTHMSRNITWFYEKYFYEQRYIVLLLGALASYLFYNKTGKRNFILECMTVLPIAMLFMRGIRDYHSLLFIFEAKALEKAFLSYSPWILALPAIMFIYWSIYLVVLAYTLVAIDREKIINLLILAAGMSSMLLMWLSPTIYGSANRVLLVCSIFLAILINKIRIDHELKVEPILLIYGVFPIVNMLIIYTLWMKKYEIHY
jgi:hypothetical protein